MSQHLVTRSARQPLVAILALAAAAIAVPLALDRIGLAANAEQRAWAWGAGHAWTMVVLGLLLGGLVVLLARPRWQRAAVTAGAAVALAVGGAGALLAAPGLALDAPPCGPAQPLLGEWHVDARTAVDGVERDRLTLDIAPISRTGRPLLADLLGGMTEAAVEDLGIESVDGDSLYARHCRALVSGSQVTAVLPLLANGAGLGGAPLVPPELPVWRGDFDWWVSGAGELVGARFRVGGHPNDAWPEADGNQGLLTVELWPRR